MGSVPSSVMVRSVVAEKGELGYMGRIGSAEVVRVEYVGKELVSVVVIVEHHMVAAAVIGGVVRLECRLMGSTHSALAGLVEGVADRSVAVALPRDWCMMWWRVLADYRRLIVDGGSRDLRMLDVHYCQKEFVLGIVVSMQMVEGRFEVGIAVSRFVNLAL